MIRRKVTKRVMRREMMRRRMGGMMVMLTSFPEVNSWPKMKWKAAPTTRPSRAVIIAIFQFFPGRLESASCLLEGWTENESPCSVVFRFLEKPNVFLRSFQNWFSQKYKIFFFKRFMLFSVIAMEATLSTTKLQYRGWGISKQKQNIPILWSFISYSPFLLLLPPSHLPIQHLFVYVFVFGLAFVFVLVFEFTFVYVYVFVFVLLPVCLSDPR